MEERLFSRDLTKVMIKGLNQRMLEHVAEDDGFLPEKCCLGVLDSFVFNQKEEVKPGVKTTPPGLPAGLQLGFQKNCLNSPSILIDDSAAAELLAQERKMKQLQAATKADDAEIPCELWDAHLLPSLEQGARGKILAPLRDFALRRWRQNVRVSFLQWFKRKHPTCTLGTVVELSLVFRHAEAKIDWWAGRDCVRRCCHANWWEWEAGSRPLHWRWPEEYQLAIRDGLKPWFDRKPIPYTVPQLGEPDPHIRAKVKEKLGKVRRKGYLTAGHVKSLTSFFTVPKGDDDVRVVYNGTKSGLNDCLWAPWFRLPTIDQHLRAVMPGTYLSDLDIAEQFHNFIMHSDLQPYAGVDVTAFFPDEFTTEHVHKRSRKAVWLRWTRCGMGFKMSPYNAGQAMLHVEEVIRGDPLDPSNPFGFDTVILNLPGMSTYNPSQPWVYKYRVGPAQLANDFFVYVDDVRATGSTEEDCWRGTRAIASRCSYLGLQDAPCKRRGPSQEAGPWAGSTVHTSGGLVTVTVTIDWWTKAKGMIDWISDLTIQNAPIPHKQLESYRGSLVYLSRTYPALVPYLKGIHLTLDSWRPLRDQDGWKTTPPLEQHLEDPPLPPFTTRQSPPEYVTPVRQLLADIEAL